MPQAPDQQPNIDPNQPAQNPAAVLGFGTQIPGKLGAQGYSGFSSLSPGQVKASLGIATNLSKYLLPKKQKESSSASQAPQNAVGQEQMDKHTQDTNDNLEALKTEFEAKLQALEDSIGKTTDEKLKKEVGGIKDSIQSLVDENE